MKVDIVIVEYNTAPLLKECLDSITSQRWQNDYQIWVVDNASSDESVKVVKENFPEVKLISNSNNLGFAKANNQVLTKSQSKYCLLLNSDTIVGEGSLDKLVEMMEDKTLGIGSCKLVNKDGSFQPNAGNLPQLLPVLTWLSGLDDLFNRLGVILPSFHQTNKNYYSTQKQIGWCSGAVMMVNTAMAQKIGGLDENIFMYGEDVEFCLRAHRQGYKIGWTDQAQIVHLGGASSKDNPQFKQWTGEFKGLLYISNKYDSFFSQVFLRLFIYIFSFIRMIAYLAIGKVRASKTYGQVILAI